MITHNAAETQAIAADLARTLHGGEVIALIGDLGAGKTTFVQGLALALGVTDRVKSPTFSVMNEYRVPDRARPGHGVVINSIKRLIHVDLYRLQTDAELSALSLADERRADTILLIEWPNAVSVDLAPDITVTIEHQGEDEREITIATK
ncbi:TPA: tRNA (adenosine(37)-N6)-threonylcarbamoyltransferase complex ATPase subunit type 1 TsaE [Candidatus Uhrbacteria bacterium]|nr:tRNA (adenosine(37)-N6)-threonylcarbamoyltransferase complex ATPase subunit type 1 TsaE [Candidatus Uhrbacteria bacterium]